MTIAKLMIAASVRLSTVSAFTNIVARKSISQPRFLSSGDFYSDFDPSQDYGYKEPQQQDDYGGGRGGGGRGGGSGGRRSGGGGGGGSRGGGSGEYERDTSVDSSNVDVGAVEGLIQDRTMARRKGDFDMADNIRDRLLGDHGVQVWDRELTWRTGASASGSGSRRPQQQGSFDRRGGDRNGGRGGDRNGGRGGDRGPRKPKNFGPTGHDYSPSEGAGPITASVSEDEIHAMLAERLQCKMSRNFNDADRIQAELTGAGVFVHDGMKEWRADGVMFGDYANDGKPGRERGSRSDRNAPYSQSEHSEYEANTLSEDQISEIDNLVSKRAGAKLTRMYDTADDIRDQLRDEYNVFVDDRLRQWSVGGDFGPDAPGTQDRNRPWQLSSYSVEPDEETEAAIQRELELRSEAKADRDFDTADSIRDNLVSDYNVVLNDRLREYSIGGEFGLPQKVDRNRPFERRGGGDISAEEEAEIVAMVSERAEAKQKRDFDTADFLRDKLESKYCVKVDDKSEF
jgi:cysteinyl-tRNA synthetase